MNAEMLSLSNDIVAAVLAGAAQGLAIVAIVWVALKIARRRANAATRHAAWFATLLIVALLPLANFFAPQIAEFAASFKPSPIARVDSASENFAATEMPPLPVVDPTPFETLAPAAATADLRIETPQLLGAILIACWMMVTAIRLGFLGRELFALRRLKQTASPAPAEFAERFDAILAEAKLSREPSLLTADDIAAPMVVGYLQPAVILPAALCEPTSASKLDHVFCHELAHLARRDDWANLAQQIITAALFFHPAVYFVSRRLTVEREIACDDHALLKSGARREYALFLTEFAGRMKGRGFTAAPAAWSSNSQLKERIGMILDKTRNCSPRVSRAGVGALAAAALTIAAIALAVAPRVVLAGPEPIGVATSSEVSADLAAPSAEPQISVTTEVSADVAIAAASPAPVTATAVTVTPAREKDARRIASVIHAPSAAAASVPAAASVYAVAPVPAPSAGLPGQPPQMPQPAQLALGHPHPDMAPPPGPRPMPQNRGRAQGGDDLERRLDRLERMVESLVGREKGEKSKGPDGKPGWGPSPDFNLKFDHDFGPEFHKEMEKMQRDVQREVERAHREVERAQRESQGMAKRAEEDRGRGQDMRRESVKARRQALEAQRRAIEQQLQALDREIEREPKGEGKAENKSNKNSNENSDSDKNDFKGDKPEKKHKEGGDEAPSAENSIRGR